MKKAIIATLVAATATSFVQAAQITWRNGSTAFTNDGTALNGNAVLLVMVDSGADAPTAAWSDTTTLKLSGGTYLGKTTLGADGKVATQNLTVSGNWSSGEVSVLGGAAFGEPGTVDAADIGYGNSNKHDFYMLVFDTSTITETSKYTLASALGKYVTSQTGTLTVSFNGSDLKNATWSPVTVPEPTTVALLALGLAAVGLKRKVA